MNLFSERHLTEFSGNFWTYFREYTGWAKRTGPVWALITQRWLPVERHVICQKF